MRQLSVFLMTLVLILGFTSARAEQTWRAVGGATSMFFLTSILQVNGFTLSPVNQTGTDPFGMENSVAFMITRESDLRFKSQDGIFRLFDGGKTVQKGGFFLQYGPYKASFYDFRIATNGPNLHEGLTMYGGSDPNTPFKLDIKMPGAFFNPMYGTIYIGCCDIFLSSSFANQIGRPDLAGLLVGVIGITPRVELESSVGTDDGWRDPIRDGVTDLGLSALSSLSSLGRTGTYPNGRNGLSMSTTSCNYGTIDIPWFAPMSENHPVICMNLFRIMNGRFEQIGASWLKHGFLSTNSGGCGSCQHPGTGTLLGPGCSDTYGTGNNGDRRYLGPRDEVNPLTGRWTCTGSWFSNYVMDCTRRNTGSGLDEVAHRLEVADGDLNVTGAEFYYEAYYINQNETNMYNQVGYRKAVPSWTGSMWNFSTTTTMVLSPAINVYGDMRATAQPRTEGDVIVAVKTTNLGSGRYKYDYAVYNFTLDRQVRSFTVPMLPGLNVTNIGFRDIDASIANDWVGSYDGSKIIWQTETFSQNPQANSLKYGTVYNFWFEVDAAPTTTCLDLGLFKPGTTQSLIASITGPPMPPTIVSGTIELLDYEAPLSGQTVTLYLRPAAGGSLTTIPNVALGNDGSYQISTALCGRYNVLAKGSHWLRKQRVGSVDLLGSPISGVSFTLVNGDVNNDNEVNIGDYSLLSLAFGSSPGDGNWNPMADLNGDDTVDIGDFAILSYNFGAIGDN